MLKELSIQQNIIYTSFAMIIDYLKTEFADRSRRNPNYSLRSFARSLKIDSSTLSAILRGKRSVSVKMAKRLLGEMNIDDSVRLVLFQSLFLNKSSDPKNFFELSNDKLETICNWEHFAILSLLQTDKAKPSASWIANKLGIQLARAIDALDRLERLGLISRDQPKWQVTHKELSTSADIPSSALRKVHKEHIEKAIESLESVDVAHRDITGMTMAIDKTKIKQAKIMIKNFRRELSSFLEEGKKNEVYRINIQFFPLTKGNVK